MTDLLLVLLLSAATVAGLVLVVFGLPGLWLIVLTVIGLGLATGFQAAGPVTIAVVVALATIAEVAETWLGFKLARRSGASSRAGWGALVGGLVGAVVGVPVPVIGSVIGAFLGSFAGAAAFEYTVSSRTDVAVKAGWGAVLGRAAAAALKIGLGLAMGAIAVFAALRG
jgi:uncharacterized protein